MTLLSSGRHTYNHIFTSEYALVSYCKHVANQTDCIEVASVISFASYFCHVVCPCHHGVARPQVAVRGTASDKEGSCE